MSFGFGIGDFITVLQLVNDVRTRYAYAPEEFKELHSGITALSITLTNLDDLSPPAQHASGGVPLTHRQAEDLKQYSAACKSVLNKLEAVADKNQEIERTGSTRHGLKRAWQRLKWSSSELVALRDQITNVSVMLNTFYASLTQQTLSNVLETVRATYDMLFDSMAIIADTKTGVDALVTDQMNQYRQDFLSWLSPNDFGEEWRKVIEQRTPGTGQWLLDSAEFTRWEDEPGRILFASGMPGAGKTMIAAIVVDHLKSGADPTAGVACTFYNYSRAKEQSLRNILASLLEQSLRTRTYLDDDVRTLFTRFESRDPKAPEANRPDATQLIDAISVVARKSSKLCIVIDALDEYTDDDGTRERLLRELLLLRKTIKANIFVTSREDPASREKLNDLFVEIRASDEDVLAYLQKELPHKSPLNKCLAGKPELKRQIEVEIVKVVRGMFLLAKLHLDDLAQRTTPRSIKTALADLPKGLHVYDETYHKVQTRINEQPRNLCELAQRVISWLVNAQRELQVTELQHALAIEEGDRELDEDNITDADILTSVCAGVVIVDKDSGIIRFVHYTAQEYFRGLCDSWIPHPATEIAKTCLRHLAFDTFSGGYLDDRDEFDDLQSKNVFLSYASQFCLSHMSAANTKEVEDLALKFLGDHRKVSCAAQSFSTSRREEWGLRRGMYDIGDGWVGAHLASLYGAVDVLKLLSRTGDTLSLKDSNGRTPLWWAAWAGVLDSVQYLTLQGHVDSDEPDLEGVTPLLAAARNGFVEVVAFLAESDRVDIHHRDTRWNRSAIEVAISSGHEAVALKLVEKDPMIAHSKDKFGRDVVYLALLERMTRLIDACDGGDGSVDDHRDNTGCTPLHEAVQCRNPETVQFLLDRGAKVNVKDDQGQTPMISAAQSNCWPRLVIEKMLAVDDVPLDEVDNQGRTALSYAAGFGEVECVDYLLQRGAQCDHADNEGRTPLSWAAGADRLDCVRSLRAAGARLDCRDSQGRTPLLWSTIFWAYHGEYTAECLNELIVHAANIDEIDDHGRTMLSYATEQNTPDFVKLLLSRGARCDITDNNARTPLSWAASNPYDNAMILEALLNSQGADIHEADRLGRTPLSYAAQQGNPEIVRVLLRRGASRDGKDEQGRTSLKWAELFKQRAYYYEEEDDINERLEVVRLLSASEETINLDTEKSHSSPRHYLFRSSERQYAYQHPH